MPLAIQAPECQAPVAYHSVLLEAPRYREGHEKSIASISKSFYWQTKAFLASFAKLRERLERTANLSDGWDTYDAERPSDLARSLAGRVLDALESARLIPSHLMPSAEGGIAFSFVDGENRAEIEVYNSGEIAAATYTNRSEPIVWELSESDSELRTLAHKIRVHLTA